VTGRLYHPCDQTVIQDYGSGTAKIAAIAAALCHEDVAVTRRTGDGTFELCVPLGASRAKVNA
jgi:hypothetical protein